MSTTRNTKNCVPIISVYPDTNEASQPTREASSQTSAFSRFTSSSSQGLQPIDRPLNNHGNNSRSLSVSLSPQFEVINLPASPSPVLLENSRGPNVTLDPDLQQLQEAFTTSLLIVPDRQPLSPCEPASVPRRPLPRRYSPNEYIPSSDGSESSQELSRGTVLNSVAQQISSIPAVPDGQPSSHEQASVPLRSLPRRHSPDEDISPSDKPGPSQEESSREQAQRIYEYAVPQEHLLLSMKLWALL